MTYNQLDAKSFIEKAKKIHGDKYDYSKVEYINNRTKVCIICPKHGEFWQVPSSHLKGAGCSKCFYEKRSKEKKMTTDEFIERSNKIHNGFFIYSKTDLSKRDEKGRVIITCPKHGDFFQTPNNHLKGAGCLKCYNEKRNSTGNGRRKDGKEFIKECIEKYGEKYLYDKTEYINSNTKVLVTCPKHGDFSVRPDHHLNGVGCPKCNESHLENSIREVLEKNSIKYFHNAKNDIVPWIGKQHLDFFLPDYNTAIECQGIQHFKPIKRFGGKLAYEKCVLLDKRKKEKCSKNGVKLYYYGINNLDNKFDDFFDCAEELLKKIKGL